MLLASLLSFVAACRTPEPPATCLELRPPCTLPAPPVRPALASARNEGDDVIVSLEDARRLWGYLVRVQAWIGQAHTCATSINSQGAQEPQAEDGDGYPQSPDKSAQQGRGEGIGDAKDHGPASRPVAGSTNGKSEGSYPSSGGSTPSPATEERR